MVAESLAEVADPAALEAIERLRLLQPVEAEVIHARLALRSGDTAAATERLIAGFRLYRSDPWPLISVMARALQLSEEIGRTSEAAARELFDALAEPFVVHMLDRSRRLHRLALAQAGDFESLCVAALAPLEPHVPWRSGLLTLRRDCYDANGHPLAARAQRDLEEYHAQGELPVWWGVLPQDEADAPELEIPADTAPTRTEDVAEP